MAPRIERKLAAIWPRTSVPAISTRNRPGGAVDARDGDGRMIGVEILSVTKLPGAKPMKMAFEILTRSDAAAAE
jgi:hypothetical protein